MVPKIIEHDVSKFCEELLEETIKNITIDGGSEKVKEAFSSLVSIVNCEIFRVSFWLFSMKFLNL